MWYLLIKTLYNILGKIITISSVRSYIKLTYLWAGLIGIVCPFPLDCASWNLSRKASHDTLVLPFTPHLQYKKIYFNSYFFKQFCAVNFCLKNSFFCNSIRNNLERTNFIILNQISSQTKLLIVHMFNASFSNILACDQF